MHFNSFQVQCLAFKGRAQRKELFTITEIHSFRYFFTEIGIMKHVWKLLLVSRGGPISICASQ